MNKPNKAEILKPNFNLKAKVPEFGGVDPEQAFKRMETVFLELKQEYSIKLNEDINDLEEFIAEYKKTRDLEAFEAIYNIVHNMRGQGATFDFPLVSTIGNSFCLYIRSQEDKSKLSADLLIQHLEALKVVYRENIKGQGDRLARTVVIALEKAVEIVMERSRDKAS